MGNRRPSVDMVHPEIATGIPPSYEELVKEHPFLFRIYSENSYCPLTPEGFLATAFNVGDNIDIPDPSSIQITQDDVLRAVSRGKELTPYITTSISFTYIFFEAYRRFLNGEENILIALIRSRDFIGNAFTALEVLNDKGARETTSNQKILATRAANVAAVILVKGFIPRDSVEALISLADFMDLMPPYFLRRGKPIFNYPEDVYRKIGPNQIRMANEKLADALAEEAERILTMKGRKYGSKGEAEEAFIEQEVSLRLEIGANLGVGIVKLQAEKPKGNLIQSASSIALEFAHFPTDWDDVEVFHKRLNYEAARRKVTKRIEDR